MSCVRWCASKPGSDLPQSIGFLSMIMALCMLKVFYKHLITAAFDSTPGISHSSASCKVRENDIQITESHEGLSSNFTSRNLR